MRRFRTPLLVAVAFLAGVGASTLAQSSTVTLRPGESVLVVAEDVATTTVPPATTLPPETTTPPPVTTVPATTTQAPATGGFVETFDANGGLDRFRTGVVHRNDVDPADTVSADHDLDCGGVDTQRTVSAADPAESFYVCRDHLMTSVGSWSGYSIAWFSPEQTFTTAETNRVSWDVNVTNLGTRQWTEVAVVLVDGPDAACSSWLSACDSPLAWDVRPYASEDVAMGNGPFGGKKPSYTVNATTSALTELGGHICDALDPVGCASKTIRRNWSMTDNRDGTITFQFNGQTWTRAGAFPDGEWKVVFKDHNYVPNKDGIPVGYTWHWDNIAITNS